MDNNAERSCQRYIIRTEEVVRALWDVRYKTYDNVEQMMQDLQIKRTKSSVYHKIAELLDDQWNEKNEEEKCKKAHSFYTHCWKKKQVVRIMLLAKIQERAQVEQQLPAHEGGNELQVVGQDQINQQVLPQQQAEQYNNLIDPSITEPLPNLLIDDAYLASAINPEVMSDEPNSVLADLVKVCGIDLQDLDVEPNSVSMNNSHDICETKTPSSEFPAEVAVENATPNFTVIGHGTSAEPIASLPESTEKFNFNSSLANCNCRSCVFCNMRELWLQELVKVLKEKVSQTCNFMFTHVVMNTDSYDVHGRCSDIGCTSNFQFNLNVSPTGLKYDLKAFRTVTSKQSFDKVVPNDAEVPSNTPALSPTNSSASKKDFPDDESVHSSIGVSLEDDFNETDDLSLDSPSIIHKLRMSNATWQIIFMQNCEISECSGCESCTLKFKPEWTDKFDSMLVSHFPYCVWKFNRYKFNKIFSSEFRGPAMTAYAECKHTGCHKLVFKIHNLPSEHDDAVVHVYVQGHFNHDPNKKFRRNLTGERRAGVLQELKYRKPNQVRLDYLQKADSSILDQGNFTDAPSLTSLQKLKSNELCKDRLSSQPWEDCRLSLENANPCGIDILSFKPFKLYWRTQYHLQAIPTAREGVVLYLDCTGGVSDDIFGNTTYYYCGVICPSKKSSAFPILEFLSDSHYVHVIRDVLEKFKITCGPNVNVKTPFPKVVVVDFSWALLHSSVGAFARQNLADYLTICYKSFTDESVTMTLPIIHLCGAHEAHAVSTWIGKQRTAKETARLARRCFRALLQSGSLNEAKDILAAMRQVFSDKFHTQETENAVSDLNNILESKLNPQQELLDIEPPDISNKPPEDPEYKDKTTLYESSPFYHFFKPIIADSINDVPLDEEEEGSELNKYFFPKYLKYLLKRQLPFYPLWSKYLVRDFVDPKSRLLTNNAVEGWFNVVKNHILDGTLRLRPADFMRIMCSSVEARAKNLIYDTEFRRRKSAVSDESAASKKRSRQARKAQHGIPAPVRYPQQKRKSSDPDTAQDEWSRKRIRNHLYTPGQSGNSSTQLFMEQVLDEHSLEPISEVTVEYSGASPTNTAHDHGYFKCQDKDICKASNGDITIDVAGSANINEPKSIQNSLTEAAGNSVKQHDSQSVEDKNKSGTSHSLTADDIRSIDGWFSDKVIDKLFRVQAEKAYDTYKVSIHCCPIYLTTILLNDPEDIQNIQTIYAHCKDTGAFNVDIWLWPLHDEVRQHYSLLIVVMKLRLIIYMDPKARKDHPFQFKAIKSTFRILSGLHNNIYKTNMPPDDWRIHIPADVPQDSGTNCGPFICLWAQGICSGNESLMTYSEVQEIRKSVREEIETVLKESTNCDTHIYVVPKQIFHFPESTDEVPGKCQSTVEFLGSLCPTLFKASQTRCASQPCLRPMTSMVYCVGYDCHDWYHLPCVEKVMARPPKGDYVCPKCRQKIRDATNPGTWKSSRRPRAHNQIT